MQLREETISPSCANNSFWGLFFLILGFVWKAICSESRSDFVFVFSSVCVVDCVS